MAGSLAEQLQSVKLRKSSAPVKDHSAPKLGGFITKEEITQYEDSVLEVNTERWMELLSQVTFPTTTCSFSIEDAKLFIEIYKRFFLDRSTETCMSCPWRQQLSEDEQQHIQEIELRLDGAMTPFTQDGFAFVKLSSRSPKDAPLLQSKMRELYLKKLHTFDEEERKKENTKITCLLQAGFDMMKVQSAREVVDMMVRSERMYQDLLLAAINRPEVYDTNFIIRKFVPIEVDMEFRGFVKGGKLNALSQYNYLIYSANLHCRKDSIQELILNFFREEVSPSLTSDDFPQDYIIDFAVCQADDTKESGSRVWVIEINPFLVTTDGALFSWEREYDVICGKNGFHFRIVTQVKPGSIKMLPSGVRDLLAGIEDS